MTILSTNIPKDRLLRWLFLLLFWGIWLGQPFLSQDDDARHREFMIRLFPITLTNVPLFFINTEWLIPSILRKKGITPYLISLILLIASFIAIELILKSSLLSCYHFGMMKHLGKSLFFVIFITGISTGYGLITFTVREEKARQEERQERLQSELSFLRSQISPHFIFNILNSIVYLIRSKSDLAEPVTIKLSELMRYMLYDSNVVQIPLEKEVDYLKNYVELQKVRFEDDVAVQLQTDGVFGSQMIEPMLMIPFVENAFKHGVGMVLDPVIDIKLDVSAQQLDFWVSNKISPDTPESKDNSSGIGLRNVKRRLELLHPDSHLLEIKQDNDWFRVHMQIKFVADKTERSRV